MAVVIINPIKSSLSDSLNYITNSEKTENKTLISSFGCSTETETTINEPIISIERYNENGELEKFSFKDTPEIEKNIKLKIKENLENKTEDLPKRSSLLNRLSNKKNELNETEKISKNIKRDDLEK